MPTVVDYWPVGKPQTTLPLDALTMIGHIVQDWVPSLSSVSGRSLMGWPDHLVKPDIGGTHLVVGPVLSRSDRQWKGFISWLIGIAGTRQVLASEGYSWVAPASAFYADRRIKVDTGPWPHDLPETDLKLDSDPTSGSALRPDYIAVGQTSPAAHDYHLALAESKGVDRQLASLAQCPPNWTAQVHNARVTFLGTPVHIHRHIVVGVRTNPTAVWERTRRIQVRCWNAQDVADPVPMGAVIEVASAALYGLCRGLGMTANAVAIARGATRRRLVAAIPGFLLPQADNEDRVEIAALGELERRGDVHASSSSIGWTPAVVHLDLDERTRAVLAPATVALIRLLATARASTDLAQRFLELQRLAQEWQADEGQSTGIPGVRFVRG